jgi:lysophospholipase L1-like esterase
VEVTHVSRRAAEEQELLAGDGLHPSGTMYAEWARLILPQALEAVGLRTSR